MDLDHEQFEKYLRQQIFEIKKFRYTLSTIIGRDPLELFSMNEIASIWITLYASEFRKYWYGNNNKDNRG